ncbi:MAG: DUF397 domain-containing protein, partial [bacterium]|nr:DUF397 domain-containing protein [bacterium]
MASANHQLGRRASRWTKSSFSGGGNSCCLEAMLIGASVAIRDSKARREHDYDPTTESILLVGAETWDQLLSDARNGCESAAYADLSLVVGDHDSAILSSRSGEIQL